MRIPTPHEADFIASHLDADVGQLAFELSKWPTDDRLFVLEQIAGHQRIRCKIPSWYGLAGLVVPPALSLEQCSSERTARYKALLCSGRSLCDLTGGFGVDFAFMASQFEKATYVEQQAELCDVMRHNANSLGLSNISIINKNALEALSSCTEPYTCIFIDPARRDADGGKVVLLEHCQPNLAAIYSPLLARCALLMAKLSPMLDISAALKYMPQTTDVHVVAVDGECKELLFISHSNANRKEPNIHCVNLLHNGHEQLFTFNRSQEQTAHCAYAEQPLAYLYEPNVAILKAGAFRTVAERFGLQKLHQHSHLYTSNEALECFPGRFFRVVDCFAASSSEAKRCLSDVQSANIAVRNFPESVSQLRKRLRIADGGNVYLFATTLANGQKVIVRCEKA